MIDGIVTPDIDRRFFIMKEVWRVLLKAHCHHYKVSNLGRIRLISPKEKNTSKKDLDIVIPQKVNTQGYLTVKISSDEKKRTRLVHQLVAEVFLNHTPCGHKIVVDHIDNDKSNNALENLQLISHRENVVKNTNRGNSNHIGIEWDKSRLRWRARIRINGKRKHLGYFKNELDASMAYQKALSKIK